MMFELDLNLGRKGRVWLDETLPVIFALQEIREVAVKVGELGSVVCKSYCIAIELSLFRGSRPIYGLLGATFSSEETHNLFIQAGLGENETSNFNEFLAVAPEIIQVGLSEEYISVILDKALEAQKEFKSLSSGKLTFNCAAHGVLASNSVIFGFLSRIVVITLGLLSKELPQEEVLKVIASHINSF